MLAFAVFEIGVRLLPPDEVRYTYVDQFNGTVISTQSGTITDPAAVAQWQADTTATPSGKYIWQATNWTCSQPYPISATYIFLWHVFPIEVVTSGLGCGDQYEISIGGVPDPQTFDVLFPGP